MKNKTKAILLSIVISLLVLNGCSSNLKLRLTDDSVEYSFQQSTVYECMELKYDDRVYRPFSAAELSQVGTVVGYYIEDGDTNYILSLDGESTDEWLITAYANSEGELEACNLGGIWKEVNVSNIPDGLEPETEYEWNTDENE